MKRAFLALALAALPSSPAWAGGGGGCGRRDDRPRRVLAGLFALGGLAALGGIGAILLVCRRRETK